MKDEAPGQQILNHRGHETDETNEEEPDRMKVSVSMVTYNHGPFIAQAIESALMQKADFDFEIVVGDDCSTDGTRSIVAGYASRHPEIVKPVFHSANIGGPRNFASTVNACTGEYVALLDGDDYWTSPHKLQRQVEFLDRNSDFSVCFHNTREIEEGVPGPGSLLNPPDQPQATSIPDLLRCNYVGTASVMYRRRLQSALPDFIFQAAYVDWLVLLSHARFGKLGYLPEEMAVWRRHKGGAWSGGSRTQRLQSQLEFYRAARRLLPAEWAGSIRRHSAGTFLKLARAAEKEQRRNLARSSAIQALRLNPHLLRPALGVWLRSFAPGIYARPGRPPKSSAGLQRSETR